MAENYWFEESPAPLFICASDGRLLRANDACRKLWECAESASVYAAESCFGVFCPEARSLERLRRVLPEPGVRVVQRVFGRTASGRSVAVEIALRQVAGSNGELHGVLHDLSERIAWERRLEYRIERLAELNLLASETGVSWQRDELERQIVRRAAETLHAAKCCLCDWEENSGGLVLLAAYGLNVIPTRGTVLATVEFSLAYESVKTGSVIREQTAATATPPSLLGRSSLLYVPLRVQGRTVGLLAFADTPDRVFDEEDVETARLSARQVAALVENARLISDLRSSEERLQQVIDGIREGMLVADAAGRITLWNPGAETLCGFSAKETLGRTLQDPCGPFAGRRILSLLREAASSSKPASIRGSEFVLSGGQRRYFDWLLFPMAGGGLTAFFMDATQRVESEREQRRMEERLRALDRLESIGRLAGGIAHDFNNLLGVILGHISHIRGRVTPGAPLDERLRRMEQAADRAADLSRQLLAFARGGKYETTRVELKTICTEIVAMLRETTDPRIRLTLIVPETVPDVEGDRGQLAQVILNICINARDAMPDGGELTLNLAVAETAPPVLDDGRAPTPGPFVLLTAQDTGQGMPPEVRSRVFEPFYTTKAPGKGTGLGLAVAYGVIKNHDGFIFVESEAGRGTVFSIYLPALESHPRRQSVASSVGGVNRPTSPTTPTTTTTVFRPLPDLARINEHDLELKRSAAISTDASSPKNKKIVIIEDEPALLELASEILTDAGATVQAAENGAKGLALFQQVGGVEGEVSLVLLDLMLPDMTGAEVFYKLREMRPHQRILLTSGYSEADTARELLATEAVGFLAKPYRLTDLIAAVADVENK